MAIRDASILRDDAAVDFAGDAWCFWAAGRQGTGFRQLRLLFGFLRTP